MFKIAAIDLSRRKTKTFVSVVLSMIVVAVLVMVAAVYVLMSTGMKLSQERMGADVVIYPEDSKLSEDELVFTGVDQMIYMDKDVIDGKLPQKDIAAITPQFFVKTKPGAGCCAVKDVYRLVGVDTKTDFILDPWIQSVKGSKLTGSNIIVGDTIRRDLTDSAFLLGRRMKIQGYLYRTGTGMDRSIFLDIDLARLLGKEGFGDDVFKGRDVNDLVSCYLIKVKKGVDPTAFAKTVEKNGINAKVASIPAIRSEVMKQNSQILNILLLFAGVVALLGIVSLILHFSNIVMGRKSEIGYMRAIGLRGGDVRRLFLIEAMSSGIIGGALGGGLGVLGTRLLGNMFKSSAILPEGAWSWSEVVLCVAGGILLAIIICAVSVLIPVSRVSREEPALVISKGDM